MVDRTIIFQFLGQFQILNDEEIDKIQSFFSVETIPARMILLQEGNINDKLYLIEYGILREFSYKKVNSDKEETNTHWLMSDGHLIYLAESYLLGMPSKISLEAIEKSKLWSIKKEDLDMLFNTVPALNYIGRVLTEQYLLKYESFIYMLRRSPEERLAWFENYHKDLINRVPLKFVASYLNMTPETLSRLRARKNR